MLDKKLIRTFILTLLTMSIIYLLLMFVINVAGDFLNEIYSPQDFFLRVKNVPSGLFNYGGSTTWAPIRGDVDPDLQIVHPYFKLRYLDPVDGDPGSGTGIKMGSVS